MPALNGYAHLAQDPGYCGGAPRVAEAGVRVVTVWQLYRSGQSPTEIAQNYQSLPLGQGHGVRHFKLQSSPG